MLLFRGCTVHCFQATKIDQYLKTYASNTSSVTKKKTKVLFREIEAATYLLKGYINIFN